MATPVSEAGYKKFRCGGMEITKTLQNLITESPGVQHIFIADKEGNPVIFVSESIGEDLRNRTQLINSYQLVMEQTAKLNMGEQKTAIFCYETNQLVVLNVKPLTVFIVANMDSSTGVLRQLRDSLEPIVAEIALATGIAVM